MQLALVIFRERVQDAGAAESQVQHDGPAVEQVGLADEQAGVLAAGGELDKTVVPESEALREVADGGDGVFGRAGDL
ncbi:MAG: hypothetical protein NVSMB62_26400 [Acidobacteriaceae bacterium]